MPSYRPRNKTQKRKSKRDKTKRKTKSWSKSSSIDSAEYYTPIKSTSIDSAEYYTPIKSPKKIGQGTFGSVYRPNIPCAKIPSSMELVSKILPSAHATKEKARIDLLPDELNGNLYYKYAEVCAIPESNKSNLIMQFIDGIELSDFLHNFKNTDNQTNRWNPNYKNKDQIPVIPLPIAISLLESIYNMYPLLLQLNRKYNVYHNDISTTNIMYNELTGKMVLIDFGMTNTECNDPFNNIKSTNKTCDIKNFFDTLSEIFDVLFYNEQINKCIIQHFPSWMNYIPKHMKMVGNFKKFNQIYTNYMQKSLRLDESRGIYTEIEKNLDEYDMHNAIIMEFVHQIISKLREL
jgi:hypothetical protein